MYSSNNICSLLHAAMEMKEPDCLIYDSMFYVVHRQGNHFLILKKCTFFCGIYCRIIPKSCSSNVFVLKIKDDFGFQNIVFVRYSNEKDNIQTGLLWTNGVI